MALLLLLSVNRAQASVVLITSIADISGPTIDFEQPGGTANILSAFDMVALPDPPPITTLIPSITGNNSAPIRDRALFTAGFLIETTGLPWVQIGLTGVGTQFGISRRLTLSAFDKDGPELGSITRIFAPANSSSSAYNAAAVFLGLGSTTPISAIGLTSDDPNVAWDNLRFNPVPEPSTLLLFSCVLAAIALLSFSRWHAATSGTSTRLRPNLDPKTEIDLPDFADSRE